MTMKPITVAIDGPAGAGKSSVAKAVSQRMGIDYLDTGAMYRAMGLYMLINAVPIADEAAVAEYCGQARIGVTYDGGVQHTWLGDADVSQAIRTEQCSSAASGVSKVPQVRKMLVEAQRRIAAGHGVVMDGRDIGTRVLPDAAVKVFLTASPQVRARRRCDEMAAKGQAADYDTILRDIQARDYQDTHRAASPLKKAEDAVEVDTSEMSLEEVIAAICRLVEAVV